ncbi:MAG: M42 family metallopeptidase [candidate division Zixibacteria bacterium]|nr:M42 family metallopeptidase [candidate division Zixibacteria bacterium]
MDKTEQLLEELTNAYGPPGHEEAITTIFAKQLGDIAEISYDKMGSVVAAKKGASDAPRVMVIGHCDEIGFMITEITSKGFLKFLPLGGWWGHVALGQRVMVLGRKGPIAGVIGSTPPHLLEPEDRKKVLQIKDMYIDVGVKGKFDVKKRMGISVGDVIVPDSRFTVMANKDMYLAKALDDRYGCAVAIQVMQKLAGKKHPNTLFSVGSVQEEVGCRGAAPAGWLVDPDVCIVLDVGIARDTPGIKGEPVERCGNGPSILIYDAGMIPNVKLRQFVTDTADKLKIKYHLTSMAGGITDGYWIHVSRIGVPTIVIGIPTRYIHSHNSIMSRSDYNASVRLVIELVKKLDKKQVKSFTQA